jgi:GT2 family glycosyltransferase
MKAFDYGLSAATGDIIWRTDDDSNPKDHDIFQKVNEIFTNYKTIDIIATEIREPLLNNVITDWYPFSVDKISIPETGYKSNTFYGAGAAIRRKVFDTIGTFWGFGYEELDFSSRAILAGFKIRYFPNLITDHYSSNQYRNRSQRLIVMAFQQVRYHSKYFSFSKSFARFIIIFISQNIEALSIRINFKLIWKLNSGMIKTFIQTRKRERIRVPKELLADITLNENLFLSFVRYFKIRWRRFILRSK